MGREYQPIVQALFQAVGEGASLYAILDSAHNIDIALRLCSSPVEYDSLYRGRSEEALWHVAPYLVRCKQDSVFIRWVLEEGWGSSWSIFLTSMVGIDALCRHFRHFLLVQDEDGQQMYFRFYDPRVLRIYLQTCTVEEAQQFFGPVEHYLVEDEDPDILLSFSTVPSGVTTDLVLLT